MVFWVEQIFCKSFASSVLPTPVGPRNKKLPIGRLGILQALARERRTAEATFVQLHLDRWHVHEEYLLSEEVFHVRLPLILLQEYLSSVPLLEQFLLKLPILERDVACFQHSLCFVLLVPSTLVQELEYVHDEVQQLFKVIISLCLF